MNFKIGDSIKIVNMIDTTTLSKDVTMRGKKGKVIAQNAKGRYLIEFSENIGSHSKYGIGKNGYCYMVDEDFLKKGGGIKMGIFDFMLSKDDKLIRDKVTTGCGKIDYDNIKLQQAILLTIRPKLLELLKDEKTEKAEKKTKEKK